MITQLWQLLKEIESEFGENTRLEIRVDDGSWVISELDIFSETTWRAVNSGNTLAELIVYLPKHSDFKPRRPLDDNNQGGYQESDLDFVMNNWEFCLTFLNSLEWDGGNDDIS